MLREYDMDLFMGRRLFSIELSVPTELPTPLALPEGHFACFLAWDSRGATVEEICLLVDSLLRSGAVYFVCWGPDCERVHDIIDEIVSHPDNIYGVPSTSVIMTTWHDSEPLVDALWFFVANSWPDDHYLDSTHAGLAISVGSSVWAAEIAMALSDPKDLV